MPGAPPSIVAVVLAAGRSRRFGDDKLAAKIGDRSLLEWALAPLLEAELERILVVVDVAAPPPPLPDAAVELVPCAEAGLGASASLRAGVEAAAEADGILVALADQPLITAAAVRAVLSQWDAAAPAARAIYEDRPGHPVLIKKALFGELRALRGDRGAGPVLDRAGVVTVDCTALASDLDVDTPADLERARSAVESGDAER